MFAPAIIHENNFSVRDDDSNRCQKQTLERSREKFRALPWDGEEQFIVVAAVQSEPERSSSVLWTTVRSSCDRNLDGFQPGAHSARSAQPRQIARETVGEVHHGAGKLVLGQPLPQGEPRLWVKMLLHAGIFRSRPSQATLQELEPQFSLSQSPAYVNKIAGAGSRAERGAARLYLADDRNVDENLISACGVSPRQAALKFPRCAAQAAQELIQPAAGVGGGKSQA